jgi:hypothetical protein
MIDAIAFDALRRTVETIRAEQAQQFAALRADLARLRARPASDMQADRIEAIADALGLREFTSPELLSAAVANTPAGMRLALHFAGCTVRSAGVRIGRLAGYVTPTGQLIERAGQVGDLTIWRVSESPTPGLS